MAHLQVGRGWEEFGAIMDSHRGNWEGVVLPQNKSAVNRKNKGDCIRMEITVGAHYAWTQRFQIPALA